MHRLLTSYALYSRYKHRRPGHIFQGRFKAKLVEDDVYLAAVTRHIHLNPVKIAAFRRMSGGERLRYLQSSPWSSYGGYVEAKKSQEFVCYDVLKEYGVGIAARRRYRAYVEACVLEDDTPLLEAMAASRYAIGGTVFVEKTERVIEGCRDGRVQNEDLDLPRWTKIPQLALLLGLGNFADEEVKPSGLYVFFKFAIPLFPVAVEEPPPKLGVIAFRQCRDVPFQFVNLGHVSILMLNNQTVSFLSSHHTLFGDDRQWRKGSSQENCKVFFCELRRGLIRRNLDRTDGDNAP